MKRTRVLAGYTITEVMIVLAVSGALFVSAIAMIGGQQSRAQFTQTARALETNIQDIMNDVSSGYYPDIAKLRCTTSASGPQIVADVTNNQGSNADCIYIGQAIQFTTGSSYIRHSIVGLRRDATTTKDVANVVEAKIRSITSMGGVDTTPDNTQLFNLPPGVVVKSISYNSGAQQVGTVVFMGELASFDTTTNLLQSQARKSIDTVPVNNSILTDTKAQAAQKIRDLQTNQINAQRALLNKNPDGGITICIEEGSARHAIIIVGGKDRPLGTSLTINSGGCP